MPEAKFADVQRALTCKLATHGIVLSSRKARAMTATFVERMRRNALTLDDLDAYVLDYQDPTGEEAVKKVMARAA